MTLVRWLMVLVGAGLIWPALFLYEDEEQEVRDRLQEWWVTLKDIGGDKVALHERFVFALSRSITTLYDKIYGVRFVTLRGLVVSAILSNVSSHWVGFYYEASLPPGSEPYHPHIYNPIALAAWPIILVMVIAFPKRGPWIGVAAIVFETGEALWSIPSFSSASVSRFEETYHLLFYPSSVLCDLAVVSVSRVAYRVAAKRFDSLSAARSVIAFGMTCAVSFLAVLGPRWIMEWWVWAMANTSVTAALAMGLGAVSRSNYIVIFIAMLWPIAGLALILHRLTWQLLRPLYALQRFNVFEYRKAIAGFGAALALGGILGTDPRSLVVSLAEYASGAKTAPVVPDAGPQPPTTAGLPAK